MPHALHAQHERFQQRLLQAAAAVLALGSTLAAVLVVAVDPAWPAWPPYLLAPMAAALAVAVGRRGHRAVGMALVAAAAFAVTAPASLYDPHSGSSGLYMLPVALLGLAFVETGVGRRRLFVGIAAAVVAHRAIRWVAGFDTPHAWVEGTFHTLAIIGLSGVLLDLLHERQRADRQRLVHLLGQRRAARADAEIEAAAAVAGSREKTRFLEAMSHELRTPLNAVVGYAELLLEEEEGPSALAADLERVRDAGRHLVALVSDVLDVSKVESGRLEREFCDIDLDDLVHGTLDMVRPLMQPGVRLEARIGADAQRVASDEQKLRQILVNLLSNAARLTHRGAIVVDVHRDAAEIRLAVRDTGPGIAEGEVQRLFEAFEQGDHTHGTGLGLALCARFAELLGGRIDVDTQLGIGSTFTLVLPSDPDGARDQTLQGLPPRSLPPLGGAGDRDRTVEGWLRVGAVSIATFATITVGLVATGLLDSHLGVAPFVGLAVAGVAAWGIARRGAIDAALALLVLASLAVDAHSHVFHPHAQAASLYVAVLAIFVAMVRPRRQLVPTLIAGACGAMAMVGARAAIGLDSPAGLISIVIDTGLVYTASALLLAMQLRHQERRETQLVHAAHEVDELRLQAQDLARTAQAATHAKATFLAAMSHELRAPLTAVLGYAELMGESLPDGDPRQADLAAIHRAGSTLLGLINEVLDLARLQAGAMPNRPETVDLAHVAHGMGLRVGHTPPLLADPRLLHRALELLSERGATAATLDPTGLHTELPMRQPAPEALFEPFAVDPCLARPGVGWALLEALVQEMGGDLGVTPGADRLAVRIRLPAPPGSAQDAADGA